MISSPVTAHAAREIFLQAIGLDASERRREFLESACSGDDSLQREVQRLIDAHDQLQSFMEQPASPFGAVGRAPITERLGTVIGPYKLLEEIGEGGFGIVYLADQQAPVRRQVALKVIKPGMDTRRVVARFQAELLALALMDHPNIARALDAGTTESGRPYFVMELVRGVPITEYCDEHNLAVRERLGLFVQVCHAVQHAHQKGIIHRDIKPSNVLVAEHDGRPVPKVIDFGVAKALNQELTQETVFTGAAEMVGTPLYMSPEQAEKTSLDIDTRSDVYSLGVLLYELLTGSTPFEKQRMRQAAYEEIRRIIREEEPPKPSLRLSSLGDKRTAVAAHRKADPLRLSQTVRGDLDWIVMKALEKDRAHRYETPNNLAADLLRYLADEPIDARPPSTLYRFEKFARRNRLVLTSVVLVGLTLIAGSGISTWQWLRTMRAEASALVAARAEKEAKEQALVREAETHAVLEFVENRIFAAARPERECGGLGRAVTLRKAIEAALPSVNRSFPNEPLIEARVRLMLGRSFYALGDARTAAEQEVVARSLYTKHLGPDHRNTLESMNDLANSYDFLGRLHDALKLREETLRLRKARFGPDHPATLTSMNHLAISYSALGRHAEALELRKKTLALMKVKLGAFHPDTLNGRTGLANSYDALGRYSQALKLHEETLALMLAKLGPEATDTLLSMGNLAGSYDSVGRHAEALELNEETLAHLRTKLGPDHPYTLKRMMALAISYDALGRLDDALKLRERTLALMKTKLGPDHPDTLSSRTDLANSYEALGRHADTLKLREETLARMKAKLGPEHPDTLKSMHNLALSYETLGRHVEALKLTEQTVALQKAELGVDHPETLKSMHNLAITYDALDRLRDAFKLREETLALMKAKLGPDHPDTLVSMGSLAASYDALGRHVEALELNLETLALMQAKLGPNHPYTLRTRMHLAISYGALGRLDDARKLREETLALAKAKLGPNHPDTLMAMGGVAESLVAVHHGADAVPVIDECIRRAAGQVVDVRLLPQVMDLRLRHFEKARNAAGCRQTTEMWEKLNRTDPDSFYTAGCFRAVTAAVLRADQKSASPAHQADADADVEADRATAWLKQAVAAGYRDAVRLNHDKDLDALRSRPAYKKLIADLEQANQSKNAKP